LVGAVLIGVPGALPSANAQTGGDPAAQVQTLLAKVHQLQARATVAEAKYAKAFNGVADSVNAAITADQDSGAVSAQAADAKAQLDSRLRGLYESGGSIATYASMLDTGSVTSIYTQTEFATRVVSAQVATVKAASAQVVAAQVAAAKAEHVEHLRIGTERSIAASASRVETLLTSERSLLATANKHLAAVRKAEAALAAESSSFGSITTSAISGLHILPPSAEYLALYKAAATTCPGLPWTVLASIGQVESGHGRNPSTSSAGAMGPMQFEPATFAAYAVDGDHDGVRNIMDPADAIYTAAHYLCANGAGRGPSALSSAILHYNHAEWYVEMVLKLSGMYASSYT
jgi:membrane-bound lytic murein transglycosylase B